MTSETTAGTDASIEHARTDSFAALDALIDAVRTLPEGAGGEPSALPDWTRGHVLAHVDGVAHALARQAEYAARGARVQPYDGGVEGRNAAIEAGSGRTLAEHVDALTAARERLAAAWPEPGSPLWEAPTSYREGPVSGCLLAWWREVRIHAVDARVGLGFDTWDAGLRAHLRDFLAVRLPEDVVLLSDDEERAPSSPVTVVSGAAADVVAWLAGRDPAGPVRATREGAEVPLPELAPWPSAQR
ncbi:maleylpyruvate isomerase family mycothiol-dependent enzyme [Myceligenerans pegani]|uniref:Maleylpyruvate isomerase family mycothiol-dependent enzyme n=1 Tax=Myceligenerans pegani TaxID=2776917 RepID=A0ABR9N236_9MICO|nr:maleylpyruvate isomerase family mycothiol-dependent enzyme [Myceligenerans sp. TRM 65318]MBE1877714.1 maleylpyruvate isomerase family mycothiol-dependent enzyme [Myceligenerans sp. TRM 65318]MBE3019985.1 maleylpyruvate isomerase family mycothiol-dependent enzyme [Myceligenerans sp. TRM 65318]